MAKNTVCKQTYTVRTSGSQLVPLVPDTPVGCARMPWGWRTAANSNSYISFDE